MVLLDKTLLLQCLSPTRCINGANVKLEGNPVMDYHFIQGQRREKYSQSLTATERNWDKRQLYGPLTLMRHSLKDVRAKIF